MQLGYIAEYIIYIDLFILTTQLYNNLQQYLIQYIYTGSCSDKNE